MVCAARRNGRQCERRTRMKQTCGRVSIKPNPLLASNHLTAAISIGAGRCPWLLMLHLRVYLRKMSFLNERGAIGITALGEK